MGRKSIKSIKSIIKDDCGKKKKSSWRGKCCKGRNKKNENDELL